LRLRNSYRLRKTSYGVNNVTVNRLTKRAAQPFYQRRNQFQN
jgi:hypothetical protein